MQNDSLTSSLLFLRPIIKLTALTLTPFVAGEFYNFLTIPRPLHILSAATVQ